MSRSDVRVFLDSSVVSSFSKGGMFLLHKALSLEARSLAAAQELHVLLCWGISLMVLLQLVLYR